MLGTTDSAAASEPELLKRIEHSCIVPVWEAQWDPSPEWLYLDVITFTTPYFAGESIYKAMIDGHRFGVADVVGVADRVLQALDHVHVVHGLLHRDVKPGNIVLDAARRDAFLGDFGSAAYIQSTTGSADGHAGSPLYLAPEARKTGTVTIRSDLYSLGVTLVEMLYGGFPYEELIDTSIDARLYEGRRALHDSYLQPDPWVPKPLATLLRSMCNSDPQKRPTNAASALRAIRSLRIVDWKRSEGEGLYGRWLGSWPPEKRRDSRRLYEVTLEQVERGHDKGRLTARARWCRPGRKWRNYSKLARTLPDDRVEVARFFRDVEEEAQSAPDR